MKCTSISLSALVLWAGLAGAVAGQSRTYTFDADFDEGTLVNVNHDAPGSDQLQLNTTTTPFPFINIAASSRGTVVRIDVNTGAILGEYHTAPNGMGLNPSRTTVDQAGNVWVANRGENGAIGPDLYGSLTRIGLVIGGTRVDSAGNPDPTGQYLKPPFDYSTAVDQDFDGLIKTSFGLGDILPWTNAGGADTLGGVTTADDECILNYVRVKCTGTRTVAIDPNNDVWVGGIFGFGPYYNHERLDVSGLTVTRDPASAINFGGGGYGGLIDGNAVLWSAGRSSGLLRYDTVALTGTLFPNPGGDVYGLGIDPNTGHIWHSTLYGNTVYERDAAGTILNTYSQQGRDAQGLAVDSNSHVWVAELFGDEVLHYAPDPANPGQHLFVGFVRGFAGTTGVAVDANGKIWASEINSSTTRGAARIDPLAGPIGGGGYPVGAIDMNVGLDVAGLPSAGPYNYSDMTGFVAIGSTAPQGTWTVIFDSAVPGVDWGTASWNGIEPAGTSITVAVRADDDVTQLPSSPFVDVSNGVGFGGSGIMGQYIEIQTTLARDPLVQDTPILEDLTIESAMLITGFDIKPQHCPNWLRMKDPGFLNVALLGNDNFPVRGVVGSSLVLRRADGVGCSVRPFRCPHGPWAKFHDVATPYGGDLCGCDVLGADGDDDLVFRFDGKQVLSRLKLLLEAPWTEVELVLSGVLCDGTEFQASDCIQLLPPACTWGSLVVDSNIPNAHIMARPVDLLGDLGGMTPYVLFHDVGDPFELAAPPMSLTGGQFVGWFVNGRFVSTDLILRGTIPGRLRVTAVYVPRIPIS